MSDAPSLVVFGTAGYAATHLRRARALHDRGEIVLAGACDVREPPAEAFDLLPDDAIVTYGPGELLSRTGAVLAVVATPPRTHLVLARLALDAGCHVLVEKPPVLDLAAFGELEQRARTVQTGFQSFGSAAVPVIRAAIGRGAIGEVTGIGAAGAWIRRDEYYRRAAWAGRRDLGDGSLTNPFAHAVASALLLNGTAGAVPESVTVELYRARDIKGDDTACARLTFDGAPDVVVAATLAAEADHDPYVLVHGTAGRIRWHYKTDVLVIGDETVGVGPPEDLLANLVRHVRDDVPLLAPLASTRAFTALVEAVRGAPEPRPLPAERREDRFVVPGIDAAVDEAAGRLALFSELDLPWGCPS
ncbi:Gfo/Idh/MocA family oxidoreductase [Amycolatopsis sp., V23-08]|uniref:Gfo/Idh/MocA family oxidoreductase n=1 Tax=Amycolatopsis heterodermiae TaxID=3110235 RepID=A0ABU5RFB6_9PSEU|nr:Gfo/Idh/MocA family oxidoreductase [Amycolatopsis sp., V23-08]MEA5364965.1 Gfo/Idh/MocA family oxidoreductase [Amycolatopsis sp., V23-08]